ncbi:MAG TPA: sugar transferase [Thermodesulfobacteriota bacterium]|nr:sugar transferase [Thermodesulfobacteriota bacterium]
MSRQSTEDNGRGFYAEHGKRALDLALSLPLLALLAPPMCVIALLVKRSGPGPVLFTQERMGRNGSAFRLYKFRTMTESAGGGPQVTSAGDPRVTRTGRVLRKYKLDELPQILNVIKGDMSLVGPRPEVRKYADAYKEEYSSILRVSPGITDYAALRFRNEEEILARYPDAEDAYTRVILPEKITLYKKYINEMGLIADLKILFRTVLEVIR